MWRVNSRSANSSGSIFCVAIFVVPTTSPFLSINDPRTFWGPLSMQLQMKIHICVVPFQGQLHLWLQSHLCLTFRSCVCRGINTVSGSSSRSIFLQVIIWNTNNPMLSSKLNVLSHNSIPSGSQFKYSFTSWGCFFQTIILRTYNPMLFSKLNVLSQNSVPHCQIWKIPSQTRVHFLRRLFWVPKTLFYLQNWTFCPIIQLQMHISVVPLQGQFLLWLQSHLFLTLYHVGGSTPSAAPYLGCNILTLI